MSSILLELPPEIWLYGRTPTLKFIRNDQVHEACYFKRVEYLPNLLGYKPYIDKQVGGGTIPYYVSKPKIY
jgi:hypothetical protein